MLLICQVRYVTNIVHSFLESEIEKEIIKSALLVKSCTEVFSKGKNFNSKARTHWSYSLCWFTALVLSPKLHQKPWLQASPVWAEEELEI